MKTKTPDAWASPLAGRYASEEMSRLFSERRKFETWRLLWLWLAEEQRRLGLPIADEAISEMREHLTDIDFEAAAREEERTRHDVMAHVLVFGKAAPAAQRIIHWGATSAYVSDNADLIAVREGLGLVERRLVATLRALRALALEHRALPSLAYTHYQPAQPTTVGKRMALWAYDLLMDLEEVRRRRENLRFLGAKGATGTQASFLRLFDGDSARVEELDRALARRAGFAKRQTVSGQTYSRKQDDFVVQALSGLAQSAHKIGTDLRLLQHDGEVEEPFEESQVGSSAMPYKRNPMRAERICALARHVISLSFNTAMTAATQWLERSLDDSANRRISLPEAFLASDAVLVLLENVFSGLVVHADVSRRRLEAEIPFLATENVLMEAVRRGGDRQELHERLRVHARAAADRRSSDGEPADLFERIAADTIFRLTREELIAASRPDRLVGRAAEQVEAFIREELDPALENVEAAEPVTLKV
ncbi:MAG: adenylosuccinate lyase [Acidobacteriota bacterium]|nr:adenylosuccinate lyase [Acidobacteriota bacterium]MDQ5872969.1 adenylosuccinate lyase [Acidobacteriota bacterium]